MSKEELPDESADLRELSHRETLDIFVNGRIAGSVRITKEIPVEGELVCDSAGYFFLSPEEDYRGGNIGAICLHNVSYDRKLVGKIVQVSGIYEESKGLRVQAIVRRGKPFDR